MSDKWTRGKLALTLNHEFLSELIMIRAQRSIGTDTL